MKPNELLAYLNTLVDNNLKMAVMIWGPPGIGKSSIVQQLAENRELAFTDLRLSQLAPTDLRGLPVPKDNISTWLPPEFLPSHGRGILFLDEINMAPPAMQGIAQQLILDRRVGSYQLPDDWFVWAAGNRKEDKAAVFDMPSPLANRFIHLDVESSAQDFRQYAFANQLDEKIISFIAFREDLLHKIHDNDNAWPSPRSWEAANALYQADLSIESAVGQGPAAEFYAYIDITENIPDLDAIIQGKTSISFPNEASLRYATITGLVTRCRQPDEAINAFHWLTEKATAEWVQLFATDLFPQLRARDKLGEVHQQLMSDEKLSAFLREFAELMSS